MTRTRRVAGVALAALLAALLVGCTSDAVDGDAPSRVASPLMPCAEQTGEPAQGPELMPPLSFDCPGGGSLDLGQAPGVPTVVNLWGSWCPPCRAEMPLLQQLSDEAGDRVRVVGVISKDGLPQAESFATDAEVTFPSAFDGEGTLMAELGINNLPYTYFLGADGGLTHVEVGPVASPEELRALVAEHLGVQL
ncbi:MAG TPA: TlpA disulfide reductase family protein [Blastococcus sp.]|jgi:cytochrome c biogenesis protein CcmG/thiol:disulfide interchange protein DsbE